MHTIAKICADHLRVFSRQNGVNLKSSHAHEIVAAFFGYKSKAAMLADKECSVENVGQAKVLVQVLADFIEQRIQCLDNLPTDGVRADRICKELVTFLELKLSYRFFETWQQLSEYFTKMYLKEHKDWVLPLNFRLQEDVSNIFDCPQREFSPEVKITGSGVELIVANSYSISNVPRFQGDIETKISIKLQRIAGHIGYSNAEISFLDGSSHSLSKTGGIQ